MNKPSPTLIGAFVLAVIVLLIGMVMYLGSSSLWSQNVRFILFFDQSVNGLNEGSMVKFRGVPVGAVERIMIRVDGQEPDSTANPVMIKFDRTRLANHLGVVNEGFDPSFIRDSIERGLVAELSLESFITGQLFVELSFDRERSPGVSGHMAGESEWTEIPTLSSSLDQITDDSAEIIADLSELDLNRLSENTNRVLENTAKVLAGIDSQGISRAMTAAADSLTGFIESGELTKTLQSVQRTLDQITETAATMNLEQGPLAGKLEAWTQSLTSTLLELQQLSAKTSQMMAPDGSLRFELETMLRELSRAARSIRMLADLLEENPNSILTGRPEQK